MNVFLSFPFLFLSISNLSIFDYHHNLSILASLENIRRRCFHFSRLFQPNRRFVSVHEQSRFRDRLKSLAGKFSRARMAHEMVDFARGTDFR